MMTEPKTQMSSTAVIERDTYVSPDEDAGRYSLCHRR